MFAIVRGPIDPERLSAAVRDDVFGAIVTFLGIVRERADDGRLVDGLEYEAYDAMALAEFETIAGEAYQRFGDVRLAIVHRAGRLNVGEIAVAVVVGSPHRGAAFDACEYAIDEVKSRAPIWKKELYADGEERWKANACSHPRAGRLSVELHRIDAEQNPVAVLRYRARRPRDVSIVVGHGYSSSKHNLDFLCSFLATHGFEIFSLDFPGHKLGASGGTLRGIHDCIDAMAATVAFARSPNARHAIYDGAQHGRDDGDSYRGGGFDDPRRRGDRNGVRPPDRAHHADEPARKRFPRIVRRRGRASGVDAVPRRAFGCLARTGSPAARSCTSPRTTTRWLASPACASSSIARRSRRRSRRSTAIIRMPATTRAARS